MTQKTLFRCSRLGALMTEPKLKADKEAGNLSETAKSFIEEMWLRDKFNYEETVMTDELMKGLLNEQDSLGLVQLVKGGEFRIKNQKHFENDFIKGTPDVILGDCIEDVKTSWSLKTFFNAELEKNYYWQGIGYMALTGIHNYRLIYCLTNTPDEIVLELKKRAWFKFGCNEENPDYQLMSQQIERNHTYDHIPPEKRIKVFEFPFSPDDYSNLCRKIEKARDYYDSLCL